MLCRRFATKCATSVMHLLALRACTLADFWASQEIAADRQNRRGQQTR